jgi:hypothetical protein
MGISANGAMLPPALASSVIVHAGTVRDRPQYHGPRPFTLAPSAIANRATAGDRAVAAGDLRYDTPAAAADRPGIRTATRRGRAGAGVPVPQSTSVWTICGLGEAPCFALCTAGHRLRSPQQIKPESVSQIWGDRLANVARITSAHLATPPKRWCG